MAPKRPSVPIVVFAGATIKAYVESGVATVTGMAVKCPTCKTVLRGNGWDLRIAKSASLLAEPDPARVPVHRLVCPVCREAGRHPWNFTVLPSLLAPRKHFLQSTRLWVFDAGLGRGRGPCGIEREVGVDRGLVRLWLVAALAVLGAALPELVAEVKRWRGVLPAMPSEAGVWERWWAVGLALRATVDRRIPEAARPPGSVLQWLTVVGARRRCLWAP
jgi:hypothetical protein